MMDFALIFILAITAEGLIEYFKNLIGGDRRTAIIQIGALLVSVALCILSGADFYAMLGATFSLPYVGCVLTGIAVSRGSNYVSDILGKLQGAGGGKYAA